MKILYRISEGGNSKVKPSYVYDKQSMFLHFINVFKSHDIYVFADNVGEDFYNFMTEPLELRKNNFLLFCLVLHKIHLQGVTC